MSSFSQSVSAGPRLETAVAPSVATFAVTKARYSLPVNRPRDLVGLAAAAVRLIHHVGNAASVRAALGLDEDDSVGAAAPVDGCGRRVLENRDRFDVIRIDRIERVTSQRWIDASDPCRAWGDPVVLERKAIDHVQRIVAGVD